MTGGTDGGTLSEGELFRTLEHCLRRHPVSLALVFGSAVKGSVSRESDVDIAVAFESARPEDDGYSDVYLALVSDLRDELPVDVDVVDVRSVSPEFARIVFEDGELVVGSPSLRAELARELAGGRPSVTDARNRIANATERLRAGPSKTEDGIPE